MEDRTLGRSGTVVSTLALGTMMFGKETDEEGSHEQLDLFLESGGTLVDTADVYTAGASEEIVGRWLDDRPADVTDRVVLATKARFAMSSGVPMSSVALSWLHDRPGVSSVILGARTTEQLTANLSAAGLHLDEATTGALDAASDPSPADYPYGPAGLEQRTRTV